MSSGEWLVTPLSAQADPVMTSSEDEYSLEPNFIFGLTTMPSNSCLFQTDDKVIYRSSGVLAIHDVEQKSQRFLHMNDRLKVITAMDINHHKNLIAVAEKGKKPSIAIYNLKNLKHVRQLTVHTEINAKSFIKIKFSYNDVFLAALSDYPDYIMYYFDWNQSKVESHMQVVLAPDTAGLVHEMSLNPVKNWLCCFVGTGLFRLVAMEELVWKQYGFHKAKKFDFTAACWLNGDSYTRSVVFRLRGQDHRDGSRAGAIIALSVSPKNKRLACVTEDARLYLAHTVETSGLTDVFVDPYGATLHAGGVCGLSVSDLMPMFMTCGRVDRTVKLWDYQQCELLLTERYAEDVLDVSLHPSGLYALVAFARSVTFNVVSRTDGLVPRRTFGAEDCRGTRFSGSGHMFAVTDGTSVDVYCSVTFAKCFKLNGHQSAITDLVWAANDWKLYTCDGDGGLCRFNLYTDQHITDMVFRGQSICGLAVSDNLKEIYTVAQDSSVREIYGRMVIRNKDLNHGSLNGIILFKSNKMLLVAGQYGVILSLPLPLKSKINYKEFYIHNKTILKMRLSTDDASLITCSADDSICIWRVKNSNFFHTNTTFMENTLVSFNFLKNKIDRTKELELKLEKLTKKKERDKLKLIKNQEMWLKVVHDQYALDMKRIENEKKEILAMFHADKARLENEISTLKENHERDWITSKENYEKQLSYEDDKYEQLIKDASNSDADFKNEGEMITAEHQKVIQKLTDDFNRDVKAMEDKFEKFKGQLKKEWDQMYLKMNEYDDQGDREMLELKMYYDTKFRKLSAEIKQSQVFIKDYKKKLINIGKKNEELHYMLDKFKEDMEVSKTEKKNLMETVTETVAKINKYIQLKSEQNDIINSRKSDMENMKILVLILGRNEIELRSTINSLKLTLKENKINMLDIEEELCFVKTEFREMKVDYIAQEDKITVISNELASARDYHESQNAVIGYVVFNIQIIFKTYSNNEVKLKDSVRELHRNFVNMGLTAYLNTDLTRKIMFLEKCLARLKIEKTAAERKPPSYLKLTKDNIVLVEEINKLKKELVFSRVNVQNLECEVAKKMRDNDPKKKH